MSPLEKIKAGILKQDWKMVADGYNQMSGDNIVVDITKKVMEDDISLQIMLDIVKKGYYVVYKKDIVNEEKKEVENNENVEKPKKKRGRPKKSDKVEKKPVEIVTYDEVQDVDEEYEENYINKAASKMKEDSKEIDNIFSKGEKRKMSFVSGPEDPNLKKKYEEFAKTVKKDKREPYVEKECCVCGNKPAHKLESSKRSGYYCNDCVVSRKYK